MGVSRDATLPLQAELDPLSSSSSSSLVAVERREQSDGRRPRAATSGLPPGPGPGVAGWVTERPPSTTGNDGRRFPTNDGRNRLRKDDPSPPRVRVKTTAVDGASTDGESSELRASVLLDTLVVAMRLSDELPPPAPPSEKMDRRLGSVSGDITDSVGDISASSTVHHHNSTGSLQDYHIEIKVQQLCFPLICVLHTNHDHEIMRNLHTK